MSTATEPSARVGAANQRAAAALPFGETEREAAARRGFVAALEPGVVTTADGTVVWDCDSHAFLADPCPASVHPGLWRRAGAAGRQGLYRVTDGVYQVRGLDLSNMTLIEGDTGVVVLDPLSSAETAAAGLALYRSRRGPRAVTGLVYTGHTLGNFGGSLGVTTTEAVRSGACPVVAPVGFGAGAAIENVTVATAVARRAAYVYGTVLPRGPLGQVGAGSGTATSLGTPTAVPPTLEIATTGTRLVIDGVEMTFQITHGPVAAAMNVHLPGRRALYMPDDAAHELRDLSPLSGAPVRDAHRRAEDLTTAITLFARDCDVVLAPHLWPTWGTDRLVESLAEQRDVYAYLHDQTVRLLNQGYVAAEVAELITLPPGLLDSDRSRGYGASVAHNIKAVAHHHLGWFDGDPARLWEHPRVESARRHVEFMGGAEEVLRKARVSYGAGDYRWVAQVLGYLVFADPDNDAARRLQAATFEQLGYGAENAMWRNIYLSGAYELRYGRFGTPRRPDAPTVLAVLDGGQILDAAASRVDGPRAWDLRSVTDWHIVDDGETHRVEMRNGVLTHYRRPDGEKLPDPDSEFTLTRATLVGILLGGEDFEVAVAAGDIVIEGDPVTLADLVQILDDPDPDFAIVTP